MFRPLAAALFVASLAVLSCTSKVPSGGTCAFSDECDQPLVCADRYCREACRSDRDCPVGRPCLPSAVTGARVCLPEGATRLCSSEADCPQGARCADSRCYVRCINDGDCLGGTCVAGGRCASPITVSVAGDGGVPTDGAVTDVPVTDSGACPMSCPVTCGTNGRCLTVTDVSAGDVYTCAVLSDGTVRCWGSQDRDARVLGDGTFRPHPFPRVARGVAEAVQIATSIAQVCVRRPAGAVLCWGYSDGTPSVILGLNVARDLNGNGEHMCAVRSDGSAVCFGGNDYGQLGDGTTTRTTTPVVVRGATGPLADVTQIAAGRSHTCALFASGAVHCWGDDSEGQLGNGAAGSTRTASATAVLTGAVLVASGEGHSCAIVDGGGVRCWGRDAEGQLGDGPGADRSDVPVTVVDEDGVPLRGVTRLALGALHSCAVGEGGTVRCWGRGDEGQAGPQRTRVERATLVAGLTASRVTAGRAHTCVLTTDGAVSCFGSNREGQLGDAASVRTSPVAVRELTGVEQASAGARHTCAVTGERVAWCWGSNENYRLGDGTEGERGTPGRVDGLTNVQSVSAGGGTCAVQSDGRLTCWGPNGAGQVGDGRPDARDRPSQVQSTGVAAVSVGLWHVLARLSDGTARAWGANDFEQLGVASPDGGVWELSTTPVTLALRDVRAVAAGERMSCAVVGDGAVRCWGSPPEGASLGDGTSTARTLPTAVDGVSDAAEVGVGESFACARSRDGTVRCWGLNDGGQAGTGDERVALTATPVLTDEGSALLGVTEIAVGGSHACARTGTSELRCWGWNQFGQLGDGTRTSRSRAVRVAGVDGLRAVTAGATHTCVVRTDGTMRCWGRDTEGQLGDGASSTRGVVVRTVW